MKNNIIDVNEIDFETKVLEESSNKLVVVDFYLEQTLYESKFVNFHPLINTLTVTIETDRFIEFMIENKKKIHIFSSAEGKVLKIYGK